MGSTSQDIHGARTKVWASSKEKRIEFHDMNHDGNLMSMVHLQDWHLKNVDLRLILVAYS